VSVSVTASLSYGAETLAETQAPAFEPTWASLEAGYQVPEWFRDAKFGIWAHWGPQCEPEDGDWYARLMYMEGSDQAKFHREHYGHPSEFGFKDVIHKWKAENWNPDALMALYKRAGAQYFFALANHHDNFDLWDSSYQPWNSTKIGPKKDLIGGWARAARAQGMRFGVSVHSSHAWTWYEPAQGADKSGPYAGVPYDGKLTKADGKGKWWEGLDPQDLYAQNHALSVFPGGVVDTGKIWAWEEGASIPDKAYCDNFLNRTLDLIDKYQPDLIYFDDVALPLWPVSDVGLQITAHFYNQSEALHNGRNEAVVFGKVLTDEQRRGIVWDVERGASNRIEPLPWQTCTCIGNWHYDRALYERHGYKSAATVIQTLADVVSKNGNLLLSVPVRADGTIDDQEVAIVEGVADWMEVNRECIFGTRPWKVYGEGPSTENVKAINAQGFNEGTVFTGKDIRFTRKEGVLYVIVLGALDEALDVKSLGTSAKLADGDIASITLLGSDEPVEYSLSASALTIGPAKLQPVSGAALVYKIIFK